MSVPKSQQTESKMQFLETGRNLYKAVMVLATKLPKRYTFYIGRSIYESARDGYRHVKAANSIYPTNRHEAQRRRTFREWVNTGKMQYEDAVASMASWAGCIRRSRCFHTMQRIKRYFYELFREEIMFSCTKLPKTVRLLPQ